MEGKSTGIIEKELETRRVMLCTVVPCNIKTPEEVDTIRHFGNNMTSWHSSTVLIRNTVPW